MLPEPEKPHQKPLRFDFQTMKKIAQFAFVLFVRSLVRFFLYVTTVESKDGPNSRRILRPTSFFSSHLRSKALPCTIEPPASPRPATGRLYDQPTNCCCIVWLSMGPLLGESVGISDVNSLSKFAVSRSSTTLGRKEGSYLRSRSLRQSIEWKKGCAWIVCHHIS